MPLIKISLCFNADGRFCFGCTKIPSTVAEGVNVLGSQKVTLKMAASPWRVIYIFRLIMTAPGNIRRS
jgi:hypothetical protein